MISVIKSHHYTLKVNIYTLSYILKCLTIFWKYYFV